MVDSASVDARGTGFSAPLEGVRAVAAIGVATTHVAFQTAAVDDSVFGRFAGRLDLSVAVFFALSGFLLWRPHAAAARDAGPRPNARRYLTHRAVRILPAYLCCVIVVLALFPPARSATPAEWFAHLTLTQVYVPGVLTPGLTQLWSLSVEVTFYLVLPLFGAALARVPVRRRVPVLAGVGLASLAWGPLAAGLAVPGVEPKNWLPGHLLWFVVGMVLAELQTERTGRRPVRARFAWPVAALAYAAACTPLAGPTGLGDVGPEQFVMKIVLGAVAAAGLLTPLVLGDGRHRLLASAPLQALGRWSYGIFIWHVAVLGAVFGLLGVPPFHGSTAVVWVVTLGLSTGVAAVSYALVESPARDRLRRRRGGVISGGYTGRCDNNCRDDAVGRPIRRRGAGTLPETAAPPTAARATSAASWAGQDAPA